MAVATPSPQKVSLGKENSDSFPGTLDSDPWLGSKKEVQLSNENTMELLFFSDWEKYSFMERFSLPQICCKSHLPLQ